ncbi:restriction endonuclease subunit S [Mycobacteroides abscessus]|uniref:restriction endonuclease subunit S n=1 Tax=Mycobacteroides abscessus TaxID=36809 RepID=UPI000C2590C9|nr:restriction endonuclease subunit S [Mycobacteroides abscessus]
MKLKRLDEIFELRHGNSLTFSNLVRVKAPDGVNFVGRAARNNGVSGRVIVPPDVKLGGPGDISVALNGQGGALASFVQPSEFVTGYHVAILSPRDGSMPLEERLWWARCIWENHYRYGFGRQANRTLQSLLLPPKVPAFVQAAAATLNAVGENSGSGKTINLGSRSWRSYPLVDLFEIQKGRRLTKREQILGGTPYVSTTMRNNGVSAYISIKPQFPGNSISVPYNGAVAYAFYQPIPFAAGDDVHVLIPLDGVPSAALLFVCGVIRGEAYKYSYGRKWHLERMRASSLLLPSSRSGKPDWKFMSDYILSRSLGGIVHS